MTQKIPFILVTIAFFISCNNTEPKQSQAEEPRTDASVRKCYSYINNKDTVRLVAIQANGLVTGTLVYNYFEKDKNAGTIQGKMQDSLLVADYNFLSEGVQSTRQVAFKRNGSTFVEGYGESEEQNGKSVFKNLDSLNFNQAIVLKEVPCEN